ncbi:unnamed protein product [Schistosoma curassoni]|uniref:RRM domain-containing protein n=1 Tax=Schistosoma curassoni TaxID=6186 RepID=A0A183KCN4_9TREM|nr:unnamed protein product [Schistosoma curassoni]
MVDTLAHTRVLQKQLNQARAERHHHQQHSRYQQQQSNTVVRSINGVTAGQLEDDTKLVRPTDNRGGLVCSVKLKTDTCIRNDSNRLIRPTTPPCLSDAEDDPGILPQSCDRKLHLTKKNKIANRASSKHLDSKSLDVTFHDSNVCQGSRKHHIYDSHPMHNFDRETSHVDGFLPSDNSSFSDRNNSNINHNNDQVHSFREHTNRLVSEYENCDWNISSSQRVRNKYSRLDSYDDRVDPPHSHHHRHVFLESHKLDVSDNEPEHSDQFVDDYASDSPILSPVRRRFDDSLFQNESVSPTESDPKHRERRRKHLGLPTLKPDHVGILSHTVFIGHLHKQLAESKLTALCSEVTEGQVIECNFIPPRGCAFVTFATRRAAHRAVTHMDQSTLSGREIKVAWAPNLGIKSREDYVTNYWDTDEGCTYLPIEEVVKLTRPQFDDLLAGCGEVDEESLTDPRLRGLIMMNSNDNNDSKTQSISSPNVKSVKRLQTTPTTQKSTTNTSTNLSVSVYSPVVVPPSVPMILTRPIPPMQPMVPRSVPLILPLVAADQTRPQQQQQPYMNAVNQQNRFPNNMSFPPGLNNNNQSTLPRPNTMLPPHSSSWSDVRFSEPSSSNIPAGHFVQSNQIPHIPSNSNNNNNNTSSLNSYEMQLTQKTFISPRPPGPLFTCQQSGLRQQIQQRLPLPPPQQQQQRHPHHQVQLESSGFRPMGSGLPLNNCRIPMNNDGILGSANPSTGVISGGGGGVMHMQWSNNNNNQTTMPPIS